jgi:hypothetical protein
MEAVKLAAPEVFDTVTVVHLADCYPRRRNASGEGMGSLEP